MAPQGRQPPAGSATRTPDPPSPDQEATELIIERTYICEHCQRKIVWGIREAFDDGGVIFCAHCRWICGFRRDDQGYAVVTSTAGGPGFDGPAHPVQGILDLAATVRPDLVWSPAKRECTTCGPMIIQAVQTGSQRRFDYDLCVTCGDVVVLRRLAATPRIVRVDAGNLFTAPRDGGPLWLARGLRLY
ncbi:MAG: hypothetical protein RIB67_03255 [Miltoncostaeaceae bacterium]